MADCARSGHLINAAKTLRKHSLYETGSRGQWVDMDLEEDDPTPSLGSQVVKGGVRGIVTAYCPNCSVALLENFD